jgi:hypothetical protein
VPAPPYVPGPGVHGRPALFALPSEAVLHATPALFALPAEVVSRVLRVKSALPGVVALLPILLPLGAVVRSAKFGAAASIWVLLLVLPFYSSPVFR